VLNTGGETEYGTDWLDGYVAQFKYTSQKDPKMMLGVDDNNMSFDKEREVKRQKKSIRSASRVD
jgi:hypothetical protein